MILFSNRITRFFSDDGEILSSSSIFEDETTLNGYTNEQICKSDNGGFKNFNRKISSESGVIQYGLNQFLHTEKRSNQRVVYINLHHSEAVTGEKKKGELKTPGCLSSTRPVIKQHFFSILRPNLKAYMDILSICSKIIIQSILA